jgi:BON domain
MRTDSCHLQVTVVNQQRRWMHTRSSNGGLPVAALFAAACIAVACVTLPPRSEAERTADAGIAAQIEARLLADPNVYARHIEVAVDRGVAHLGGFVWSNEDFQVARRDAASIAGVKSVSMDMELMRGGISGSR